MVATDLFFSEYIEGSSNNKAIELFNGTGGTIDLSNYTVELYSNGATSPNNTETLTGTLADGEVFVIANSSADAGISDVADITSSVTFFNGDDALVLRNNGTVIDVIGQVGNDPGSEWGSGDTSTQNNTIRRQSTITSGDTDETDAFDPATEWNGFPQDTFAGLGSHTFDAGGTPTVGFTLTESNGDTIVGEDASTDSFDVVLDVQPTSDVVIDVSSSDNTEATVNPISLTFTNSNWDTPQTVTVTGVDDTEEDGDVISTVTVAVNDANSDDDFDGLSEEVSVTTTDNEFTVTPIHEIQGSGVASPLEDQTVTIEGIVTGDFQDGDADDTRNLRGFYVQEEDTDADNDPLTSEGIFVFDDDFGVDVNPGDKVQVTGTVDEFFGLTEITSVSEISVVSPGNPLPTTTEISLPVGNTVTNSDGELIPDLEQYEGMLTQFTDTLTVTEMFNLDRFGEIRVSQGGRLEQFTQNNTPDAAGFEAHLEDIASRTITIDDGQSLQNPDPIVYPDGSLDTADGFRMGDTVTDLTGVLHFSRGSGGSGDETYRVMPTVDPTFVEGNPRPATPEDVGGSLKVASLNVLNYFTTIDDGNTQTVNGNDPRGADDLTRFGGDAPAGTDPNAEFNRQTDKLVTAIGDIDADILGLVELENNFQPNVDGNAIEALVNELNTEFGAGTYDWVNPGTQFVGGDAIAAGFIYKPATVDLAAGTTVEILDDSDFGDLGLDFGETPVFNGNGTNRSPLAATFEERSSGETLTITVNHFKSKGSVGPGDDDPATGDGQGNNNGTRLRGAEALDAWLDSDPTGSGDDDFLILGDLNAYAQEDPLTFLADEGYTDLAQQFIGNDAYSFVFDGQTGTLDYALSSPSLTEKVTGTTEWHVNADEADAIDYNLDFGRNANLFDGTVPYRNSDHDPVIVGLELANDTDPSIPVVDPIENAILASDVTAEQTVVLAAEVIVTDADTPEADLSFSLTEVPTNSNGDPFFAINPTTGEIEVTAAGVTEINGDSTTNFYNVGVTAFDGENFATPETFQVITQVSPIRIELQLEDENGTVIPSGDPILGETFSLKVLVGDERGADSAGVVATAYDLTFSAPVLQNTNDFEDIENDSDLIPDDFPLLQDGELDNVNGTITNLGAGALPTEDGTNGNPIGTDSLATFSTLNFTTANTVIPDNTRFTLTLDPTQTGFADGVFADPTEQLEFTEDLTINQAPLITEIAGTTIAEDAVAETVIVENTLINADEDELGDPLTFTINAPTDSNGDPLFAFFDAGTNSFVSTAAANNSDQSEFPLVLTPAGEDTIDFETQSNYQIDVTASDEFKSTTETVEVNLTDVGESLIDVSEESITFSTPLSSIRGNGSTDSNLVRPGLPDDTKFIDITNTATNSIDVLDISSIEVNVPHVTLDPESTQGDILLNPGETHRVSLTYAPNEAGDDIDLNNALVINSNAVNNPALAVRLIGESTFDSDINYDGTVDLNDLAVLEQTAFLSSIGDPGYDPSADINGDGNINRGELVPLSGELFNSLT